MLRDPKVRDSLSNSEQLSQEVFQFWLDESISATKVEKNMKVLEEVLKGFGI